MLQPVTCDKHILVLARSRPDSITKSWAFALPPSIRPAGKTGYCLYRHHNIQRGHQRPHGFFCLTQARSLANLRTGLIGCSERRVSTAERNKEHEDR